MSFSPSKTPDFAAAPEYMALSSSRRRVRASTMVAISFTVDIIEANDLTSSEVNVSAADSDPVLRPTDLKHKGRQIEDSDRKTSKTATLVEFQFLLLLSFTDSNWQVITVLNLLIYKIKQAVNHHLLPRDLDVVSQKRNAEKE